MHRTHTCGELRAAHLGERVTLCGWVQRIRDKGKVVWIDMRDRYGVTQLVVEAHTADPALFAQVHTLGREYVIAAEGEVVERVTANPKLATGAIEVRLTGLRVYNKAEVPPFIIEDETDGSEELRMRYRYLDLRRCCMQENLLFRERLTQLARAYLSKHLFIELESPILVRSTPEGARDFIVPARKEPGKFYALPQSPQTLKQLFMIGGMDRYFQFARCFRDEDLRADRQPEFVQLDCELSFVEQGDIMAMFEGMVKHLFQEAKGITLADFPVMTYAEAMGYYGSDKPDLRWGMPFVDLTAEGKAHVCPLWEEPEVVHGICVKGGTQMSRKVLDRLSAFVKEGAWSVDKVAYIKCTEEGARSSLSKWYPSLDGWVEKVGAGAGDLVCVIGGQKEAAQQALGALRLQVVQEMQLTPVRAFAPLWVVDFPLLEWSEEEGRYHAMHHPFAAPKPSHISLLTKDPARACAQAYDLVINGVEIGGGSIRIHDRAVQEKMFHAIGIDEKTAVEEFGTLLTALTYGAPPHGGIALGWERLCLVMKGGHSIRDYMAFPKNNAARDVMLGTPAPLFEQK